MAEVLSIFNPAYVASMQALRETQVRPVALTAKAPPPTPRATPERFACRAGMLVSLAKETGIGQRDAIRRLWILSKCKLCAECADMSVQ